MRDRPPFSYLLVHSPLVGPRSWEPVAAVLASRNVPVAVPSLLAALPATENRHDALAAAAVGGLPGGPWLVVVHSGAGALVPLAYLEAVAPPHRGWEGVPCGYLRLSDAYVDEEAEVQRRGWPTVHLDGHHLSAVTDPEALADAVLALARELLTK